MRVRPFDWRDLLNLYRQRRRSVFLYNALVLTRGPLLVQGSLLSSVTSSAGIFTSVASGGRGMPTLMGQIIHPPGAQAAYLTFLTPEDALSTDALPALLDELSICSGARGAFRLLAEADEHAPVFEMLRRSTFAVYSRQRVWQLTGQPVLPTRPVQWQPVSSQDVPAIRSLYYALVPGLVQQVEVFPSNSIRPLGLAFRKNGELLAYVELKYGPVGIWVQPLIHPDADEVGEWFADLICNLPNRRGRPVYICIRSYQSWLEPAVEDLGAEAGPRQALMVRHLAILQKNARTFSLPILESGGREVSTPISRVTTDDYTVKPADR